MKAKIVLCTIVTVFLPLTMAVARSQTAPSDTQEISDPATVRTVQRALRERGFYGGPIDGTMSELTRKSLLEFQGKEGLNATGMVDRSTLAALGIIENHKNPVARTGEDALKTAQTAGQATVAGTTAAGKSTARGLVVAGESTATGLETAGKGVTQGGEAALGAAEKVGKTISQGATRLGRTTAEGARKAGEGVTDFLGVGQSDGKIRKQIMRQLVGDSHLSDVQVHVLVEGGVVTLTFGDSSSQDQDRAAAIARAVRGVKDVQVR